MKVFIAGATGAIGAQLIPRLVAAGHDVVGMTRSPGSEDQLRALGARAAVADALDAAAVAKAVADAAPDVVIHQLTALSGSMDMRHIDKFMAATNLLRTKGTDNLLAAAEAAGVRKFIAQGFAPYVERGGIPVKDEAAPMDPNPPETLRTSVEAVRHIEETVPRITWGEGIVLRYGAFYGPGTAVSLSPDADTAQAVAKRKLPLVGGGTGVWSFVHVADAAAATVAAIDKAHAGIYNVADDEPALVSEWVPALAKALGAKPPRRVPRWLGRLAAGEAATVMLTEARGVSNKKAKRELGWTPRYPSWRQGFKDGLG